MKIEISNSFITDNSKECDKNSFFLKTESNSIYEKEAIKNGAKVITPKEAVDILGIDKDIKIVGITGTNGKTTTAAAIYSTLLDLGYKCSLAGTRGAFINDKRVDKKGLTTGSVICNLNYLLKASKEKCDFFIMEVSSHAIAQNRIEGLKFALKVFTNLSQDHLDYHKTFKDYADTKSSFFKDESLKLINRDDENIKFNFKNAYTYAIKNSATFKIQAYGLDGGINAILKTPNSNANIDSSLIGEFNVYNLTAAFCAVKLLTDRSSEDISKALSNFGGVEGRVEIVSSKPLVIVDFAHTPDGMEKVLSSLKSQNIITVFGAGGDRDKTKRPLMGKIAQRYSKICVVTSDNPRTENKESIIDDILEGMFKNSSLFIEADRFKAIKLALSLQKDGDIVAILGKGDEDYQEINGVKHHFSDKESVLEILGAKNED